MHFILKWIFSGKVFEIVNQKMFSDVILKDTSSITLTGQMGTAMKTQIVNMISDNTLKTTIEMFTYNLPAKQVATGENWNIPVRTNSGGDEPGYKHRLSSRWNKRKQCKYNR